MVVVVVVSMTLIKLRQKNLTIAAGASARMAGNSILLIYLFFDCYFSLFCVAVEKRLTRLTYTPPWLSVYTTRLSLHTQSSKKPALSHPP
jgi:hypothetical protein